VTRGVPSEESRARSGPVTAALTVLLPDEPLPLRLMNTIWADRLGGHDALTSTANLATWLAAAYPAPGDTGVGPAGSRPRISREDLNRFRALRVALRRVAQMLTGDTRPAAGPNTPSIGRAVADINDAAASAPAWPQLVYRAGELSRSSAGRAGPGRRALSDIARQSIDLFTGEDRDRLRACFAPGCVLYFVKDHPRRQWCSTACGNRVRAARHYRRHHKQPSP
jgi:predicted RNA-binding Zn ribbon-like protein